MRSVSAEFSPDGRRIVTAGERRWTARVWRRRDGRGWSLELKGHTDRVNSATFSPDGRRILTASATTRRLGSGRPRTAGWSCRTDRAPWDVVLWVTFSPDGRRIVTTSSDHYRARVWDAAGGQPLVEFKGP